MGIRFVVAVTDQNWFDMLRREPGLSEANFWSPSPSSFRALERGQMFLFKLKGDRSAIAGGGLFQHASILPCSYAWKAFGKGNGATSEHQMRERINRLRGRNDDDPSDFKIGCRILAKPFFFEEANWFPPLDWSPNIVSYKTYDTDNHEHSRLWDMLKERLQKLRPPEEAQRYGRPSEYRPRLGQGAFRVLVADSYGHRCAVTGERTMPAVEAAHIRPFADGGQHEASNGLLLRSDVHSLFDSGYVTITPKFHFEVSPRIKGEFGNGRDYYALHGQKIHVPGKAECQPDCGALEWHNENRYLS